MKSNGDKKISIKVNFIYSVIYQMLLILLPLITSPYVSRVLSSEGIGIYSYTYSIANCFALFGMLGISNHGNRTIAACRDNKKKMSKKFFNIWTLQISMTLLVVILYSLYVLLISNIEYRLALWIQLLTICCSFCDISWFFFGIEKFKITITRNLIIKSVSTVLVFILVKNKDDLWIYTLIISGGMLFSNLALIPFLKKEIIYTKPELKEIILHIKPILVLFIPVLAVTLYKRIDKIMLGSMSTMSYIGFYENAEKIINIPMGIITALGTVMMPRMSYLIQVGDNIKQKYYLKVSSEFTFCMSSALAFGIASISKEFAPFFFGKEFEYVGILIQILSCTTIFISLANVIRSQYLIPMHKDKIYILSVWIGAIVNIVLNCFLIPKFQVLGAAYATAIAEAIVLLFQAASVRNEIPIHKYAFNGLYYIFSGILMYICVRKVSNLYDGVFGILIEIIIGMFSYFILCSIYWIIKYRDKITYYIKKQNLNI